MEEDDIIRIAESDLEGIPPGPERAPESTVVIRAGEEFTFTLEANPSTGYYWAVAEPLDEGVVKLVGKDYRHGPNEGNGSGGHEVWTFKAAGKGQAKVSFRLVGHRGETAGVDGFTLVVQ